jgi:large subunit ribosomal protein L9
MAAAFEKVGVEVNRSEIRMPDGPIHEIGDFVVGLHLHSDINVDVTVKIVAEE